MTDDLVNFQISAPFILQRAFPTAAELALGYERGWLRALDVVELALAKYKAGQPLHENEEDLALLLPEDIDEVERLVPSLAITDQPAEQRERFWLFLVLDWLWEHRNDVDEPLKVVELLCADFGYPEEIAGLIWFMPESDDAGSTPEERWAAYVARMRAEYKERVL